MDTAQERAPFSVRRPLLALGLAAVLVLSTVRVWIELTHLVLQRWDDLHVDVPFQGWQVIALEVLWALALLAATVLAARVGRRAWRSAAGSAYRRVPVLVALLPGIWVGAAPAATASASVSWASDHTAAAESALRELEEQRAAYLRSPTAPIGVDPAPAALAARLVHAGDLGGGWYDGASPNPHALGGSMPGASSFLVRTHREGLGWAPANPFFGEYVRVLPTAAEATRRALTGPDSSLSRRFLALGGLTLLVHEDRRTCRASFAVGTDEFTVIANTQAPADTISTADCRTFLTVAVRRARFAR